MGPRSDKNTISKPIPTPTPMDGSTSASYMNDETEEHATSTNTTNGKKEQQRPPTTNWKRFIFDIVYRIVGAERTLQPNGKSPRNRHLVATTMMTMILTAAICLARSRCRFRGLLSKFQTLLWSSLRSIFKQPEYRSAVEVSLSVLQGLASKGLIKHAYVGASEIIFKEDHDSFANATTSTWKRSKLPPNSPAVQSSMVDLLTRGGCDDVSALPDSIWSRLSSPLLAALPFVYLGLMYRVLKNMNGTDMSSKIVNDNHLATRFQHVAGLDHVMVEVQDIVSYLQNPSSYTSLGALPPRGILLHGPPGSGKTLLAKAVAGEAKCNAFISCVGSDFCEMYVGRGASRIRSLFQRARSAAAKNWTDRWIFDFGWMDGTRSHRRPGVAIIFIDELDALAKSRTFGGVAGNDERDQTLNQLLAEMDGFSSSSSSSTANGDGKSVVIVIAATNRPDCLDPAILRRFDRQIHVPYPNQEGRRDILKVHARRVNCNVDTLDWEKYASDTDKFSGSDLRNLVNDSALIAVRRASKMVEDRDFELAIERAKAMKGSFDMTRFALPVV